MSSLFIAFLGGLTARPRLEYDRELLVANKMNKTETLNLRVAAEFKKRLTEKAAKERRSITNYLEVVLTDLWQEEDAGQSRSLGKKTHLKTEKQK